MFMRVFFVLHAGNTPAGNVRGTSVDADGSLRHHYSGHMVDLHQVEPGLPDGHPWKTCSRWQMAWRTFLAVSLVGLVGTILFSLVPADAGSPRILTTPVPFIFGVLIPIITATLTAVIGPMLRRYFPFTQSLLAGAAVIVAMSLIAGILSVGEWLARGACPPDTLCSSPIDGVFWVLIVLGLPGFLASCTGFGLAIWSATRKGRAPFWILLIVAWFAFTAMLAVAYS